MGTPYVPLYDLSCLPSGDGGTALPRVRRRARTRSRSTARRWPPHHVGLSPPGSGPATRPQPQVSGHRGRRPHPGRGHGRSHSTLVDPDPDSQSCLAGTTPRNRSGRGPGLAVGPPDRRPQVRSPGSTVPRCKPGQGVKRPPESADVQGYDRTERTLCIGG
jgi:hypothetical protein